MSIDPETLFNAALELSERQRLELAFRILDTMPPENIGLSLDDPNLREELDRRFADRDESIPWSELRGEE
jgi:putative addiction module component (TIGR02574 family)